jgi:hypothetical protein
MDSTTQFADLNSNLREEMGVTRASVDAWVASQTRHLAHARSTHQAIMGDSHATVDALSQSQEAARETACERTEICQRQAQEIADVNHEISNMKARLCSGFFAPSLCVCVCF